MNFNFEIDTTWCLDQLFKDGRITEKEKKSSTNLAPSTRSIEVASITVDCSF